MTVVTVAVAATVAVVATATAATAAHMASHGNLAGVEVAPVEVLVAMVTRIAVVETKAAAGRAVATWVMEARQAVVRVGLAGRQYGTHVRARWQPQAQK